MTRKAQAATEFLMTYGWAILVVLAAITALSFFGVQKIQKSKPNTCLVEYPFVCLDSTASDGNISFVIVNNAGKDSTNVNVTMDYEGTTINCAFIPSLENGKEATIKCSPPTELPKTYVSAKIRIDYNSAESNFAHSSLGSVSVTVN